MAIYPDLKGKVIFVTGGASGIGDEADAERATHQAIKRRIYPDDITKLTLFLASEDASAITGQDYVSDGGWV